MAGGRRFTECVSSWLLLLVTEAAGREIADNKVLNMNSIGVPVE